MCIRDSFIAMQLSLAGIILSILTDNIIGSGSASLLIGSVIIVYLSLSGIRSLIYIDTVNFLFTIFGIIALGFIAYDLVGGWSLLNESLSRISNIKENLFNPHEGLWAETKLNSQFRENTTKWRGVIGVGFVALLVEKVGSMFTGGKYE